MAASMGWASGDERRGASYQEPGLAIHPVQAVPGGGGSLPALVRRALGILYVYLPQPRTFSPLSC